MKIGSYLKMFAILWSLLLLSVMTGQLEAQTITSMAVEPVNPHVAVNGAIQFRAVGTMSDGSRRAISPVSSPIASSGYSHTCAVLPNGKVKCWGNNWYGELGIGDPPPWYSTVPDFVHEIDTAMAVTTGDHHSCAVLSDGAVKCWGSNAYGQLGDNSTTNRSLPVSVVGISTASAVAGGTLHTCAGLADGTVQCWGFNGSGQLGNDTHIDSPVPVPVSGISTATAVAAGDGHSCALLSDGTVQCWGYNGSGQSGNGSGIQYHNTPVFVTGITTAVAIDADGLHTCALLSNGSIKCWGFNNYGELGNDSRNTAYTPVSVIGINTATGIATGNSLSCAVLADGTAKCWGYNGYGGLGDGSYTESHVPVSVSGINTATAITAGYYHACALLSDGSARCWGYNTYGALGDGTGVQSNIPVRVSDLRIRWNAGFFANAADLAIGGSHVCAALAGGAVQCWGSNQEGQLGLGSTVGPESCLDTPGIFCSTTPEPVTGIGAVADVAAGSGHTCAALSNGTVQCWGGNDDGQLGNGTTSRSSSPVAVSGISSALKMAAGSAHTCVALSDHSVQCWGDNFRGELGTDPASGPEWCGGYPSLPCSMSPVPVNGITTAADVTAGNAFSCARLSDGSVKCWGHNDRGQLGNGFTTGSYAPVSVSGISNAAAIAAGSQHTCAVLLDDTVKCWGYNGYGQLGSANTGPESCDANPSVPCSKTPIAVAGINNAKAIAAGGHNTCVLLSNGSVQCWGSNQAGQLGNGLTTNSSAPVFVNGINDAVAIAAGGADTCAVLSTGWVKCWGGNVLGELGIATSDGPESCTIPAPNPLDPPITVSCSTNPVQVIQDTAATLVWSSSNLPVATINNRGMATGLGDGLSPITAALGPLSGSTLLAVGTVRLFLPIILRP